MSGFNQEMHKGGGKSGSRFGFLRTKKVLATLSLLVVVAVILIVTPVPDRRQFPGSIANGTALRIMPLGASTVRGENSPGNTGFRKPMRDALVALNVSVNMVGSQQVGDFADNDVEAYLGVRVSQIHERSKPAVRKYRPNVFIINAGINNALMNFELDTAGQDMDKFIRDLLATSPRALVVLSTLTPSRIPHCEPLIQDINGQFQDLYARLKAEGLPIVVADVHYAGKEPDALQLTDITSDGTHPTGEGYQRMARIYTKAIQRADSSDFLQVPVPLAGVPDDGASPAAGASSAPKSARRSTTAHEHRRRFLHMKRELCITSNPNLWGKV
ncbi:carbohydrate esterase family 3 protein [Apiospora rasikravindrae]|uniref:Carbohydrate esterase family 3 protein n=1 Tax=Apiospora rasikravindrae TaxID=990691 RepID=A0ABR1RQ61_9PEZI